MKILLKKDIENALDLSLLLERIEEGFVTYSKNEAVIPPVGSLHFEKPEGECHIKYGYAKDGPYYVVKIASGFPQNPSIGLPACNGLMLLFDKQTGKPLALLCDEGYLTDLRTAIAGAVAAKYLAPRNISAIGIIGTGAQSYFQLKLLPLVTKCKQVIVYGRDPLKAAAFARQPNLSEFDITVATKIEEVTDACNLIVTTTSAKSPLIFAHQIRPGTHITAMGADDIGKQELESALFTKADRIAVDSRSQCSLYSDTSFALKEKLIDISQVHELGEVILHRNLQRTSDDQITIADLTGVAIQDLQIATLTYQTLSHVINNAASYT